MTPCRCTTMPRSPGRSWWRMRMVLSPAAISHSRRRGALRFHIVQRELQEHRALDEVVEVVVGDHRQDGRAAGIAMHGEALHVVDVVARVDLYERAAGDARAGRN